MIKDFTHTSVPLAASNVIFQYSPELIEILNQYAIPINHSNNDTPYKEMDNPFLFIYEDVAAYAVCEYKNLTKLYVIEGKQLACTILEEFLALTTLLPDSVYKTEDTTEILINIICTHIP